MGNHVREMRATWRDLVVTTAAIVALAVSVLATPKVQAQVPLGQSPATKSPAVPQSRASGPGWDRALDQVGARTEAEWNKAQIGSVTIGVVSDGQLTWSRSYGDADTEKKIAAGRDTVYRIGSITKQFTALMLLQLEQRGRAHPSDPVEKYFPEVNRLQDRFPGAPPITLQQLALHIAGIDREPDDEVHLKGPVSDWERTLIAALPHTKYLYAPGKQFSYSNIGYAILGAALSRAAGQPYVEYVRQKIFIPLGMTHSGFEATPSIRKTLAKGYEVDQGQIDSETPQRENDEGRGYKVPNGAIYTTVGDLARFVAFEMGHGPASVLQKGTLENNYKSVIPAYPGQELGIGFFVHHDGDLEILGFSGGVAGYEALAYFNRPSHIGVILLKNSIGQPFDGFGITEYAIQNLIAARGPSK